MNNTIKQELIYGLYEGHDDQWGHVFTFGVSPAQAVGVSCGVAGNDLSTLNSLSNITLVPSSSSELCEGDRTLANVTYSNGGSMSQSVSDIYWMADTTSACVAVVIDSVTTALECRQNIGGLYE